jgi:hypothetical protein
MLTSVSLTDGILRHFLGTKIVRLGTFCSGVLCESKMKETQVPQGVLVRYVARRSAIIFVSKSDAR